MFAARGATRRACEMWRLPMKAKSRGVAEGKVEFLR
jgi:hypothetical protein